MIILGVTSTLIFAGHSTPDYDLGDLMHLYGEATMRAYIIVIICILSGMFVTRIMIERKNTGMCKGEIETCTNSKWNKIKMGPLTASPVIAHMIQYPGRKPNAWLIMMSEEGAGKA